MNGEEKHKTCIFRSVDVVSKTIKRCSCQGGNYEVRGHFCNKKEFIKRLLKEGSNIIWPKEMKMANLLIKIFPNQDFWESLELNFKLNSLCWLLSDDGRKFLNKEYKKFNLNLPEIKKFEVENNNIAFENKKTYDLDKALNLREFLNLWQKKTR